MNDSRKGSLARLKPGRLGEYPAPSYGRSFQFSRAL